MTGDENMFLEKKDEPSDPVPGILTGVMEPQSPAYERERSLRVEDLPEVILNLQATVEDLQKRMAALEDMVRQIVATYKSIEPPKR